MASQAGNQEDTVPSEEYLYTVSRPKASLPHAKIKVSDCNIQVMLDSGASVNIIDETTYQKLKCKPPLTKSTVPIFPYGSRTPLPAVGKFASLVESKLRFTNATFHVLQGSNGNLLGYDTATQLGLITVATCQHTSHIPTSASTAHNDLKPD